MNKSALTVASCLLATSMLAACGSSQPSGEAASGESGSKVTLRFATNSVGKSGMAASVSELLKQFKEENPNVNVVVEEANGTDLAMKIKVDVASNNTPDVFMFWRPDPTYGMDKFIQSGAIADLTELKNDPQYKDLFDDSAWNTATVDGKVRAIPMISFFTPLFVNKEIFNQAGLKLPETWDELLNATKTLKQKGFIPWGISLNPTSGTGLERPMDYVLSGYLGNERALNLFAGKETFNDPEVVKSFELLRQLTAGYAPEDAASLDDSAVFSKYINTGKAAMTLYGMGPLMSNLSEESMNKFTAIPFPTIPGGKQTKPYMEKDLTMLLYASSDAWKDPVKKEAAAKLIKKLSTKEAGKLYVDQGKQIVPMQGVDIDPAKINQTVVDSMKLAAEEPGQYWLGKYMQPQGKEKFWPQLASFWSGQVTAEQLAQMGNDAFFKK
ncbi:ABC transporter substrate-binding protein [Paenibacillus sp. TAB 01]|uniref:ABC transporter substrate-binding protein n=1 Tax=Paenibacillus sp. TAB 01 TaxID=3368988 RepID=UPI003751D7EE